MKIPFHRFDRRERATIGRLVSYMIVMMTTCHGYELKGALLSHSSGASGAGTGIVRLLIKGRVNDFVYQKPLPLNFKSDNCYEPGRIWSVKSKPNNERDPSIIAARCTGSIDVRIHSAWSLVKETFDSYMRTGALSELQLSKEFLNSDHYKQAEAKLKNVKNFSHPPLGRSGWCLEVQTLSRRDQITIDAGASCYLGTTITFSIVTGAAGAQHIDDITVH